MDSKISNRTFYFACKRFFGCGCYPILKDTQGSKIDKVAEFGDNFNTNSNVYMRLTKFDDSVVEYPLWEKEEITKEGTRRIKLAIDAYENHYMLEASTVVEGRYAV